MTENDNLKAQQTQVIIELFESLLLVELQASPVQSTLYSDTLEREDRLSGIWINTRTGENPLGVH
jgi:hypothetical protein